MGFSTSAMCFKLKGNFAGGGLVSGAHATPAVCCVSPSLSGHDTLGSGSLRSVHGQQPAGQSFYGASLRILFCPWQSVTNRINISLAPMRPTHHANLQHWLRIGAVSLSRHGGQAHVRS